MKHNIKDPIIAILGLGYVGLPLAIEFSKHYTTFGYDIDKTRIKQLNNGKDITQEVKSSDLMKSNLIFSTKIDELVNVNTYIITVPTPVDKYKKPNMSALLNISSHVGKILKKGDVVIYESTVYPGATEEFCVPALEKNSGLKYNNDFFCGYSPERINPGDKTRTLKSITKIVSGSTPETLEYINEIYSKIISVGTFKASSIKIAEAAKVIENIQRDVNIALVNELSILFDKLNIRTSEVLEAAETKWNFLPFKPGIVGGHCIGVDPYYLTYKAQEIGYHPEIILAGRRINDNMGLFISESTIKEMVGQKINPSNSKVAVLGITFKENCPDIRNTKVPDIINNLKEFGCNILISDPIADPNDAKKHYDIELCDFNEIRNCDVVLLAVAHEGYKNISSAKWKKILAKKAIVMDVKSIYDNNFFASQNVIHWKL